MEKRRRDSDRRKSSKSASKASSKRLDTSVDEFRLENESKYFSFGIPQPPGDPKLLDLPVDVDKAEVKFDHGKLKTIGAHGLQLLQTRQYRPGLKRRAKLPALHMHDGVRVLSLVPYADDDAKRAKMDDADMDLLTSGAGLAPNAAPRNAQGKVAGSMNWVMDTSYISNEFSTKSHAKPSAPGKRRQVTEEGNKKLAAEKSFKDVSMALKNPFRPALKLVKALPILPWQPTQTKNATCILVQGKSEGILKYASDNAIFKTFKVTDKDNTDNQVSVLSISIKDSVKKEDGKEDGTGAGEGGGKEDADAVVYNHMQVRDFKIDIDDQTYAFLRGEDQVSYIDMNASMVIGDSLTKADEGDVKPLNGGQWIISSEK